MPPAAATTPNPAPTGASGASSTQGLPFTVNSPDVTYTEEHITSQYIYRDTTITKDPVSGSIIATPTETAYTFRTERKVPKVGVMLVGWGGNNGSTLTASLIANRKGISWRTKDGQQNPNYFGSVVMASTLKLGTNPEDRSDVYIPFHDILPMAHPNDLVLGGWDISSANLAESMERAKVLEYDLQRQVRDELATMKPLPSIYYPDYIAANQGDRADNVLPGSKADHLAQIRKDIRHFRESNSLDKVIVLWTANTERYSSILPGVNTDGPSLLSSIENGHEEVAPSTIFAVASILEGSPFINGSPQNTFVPGVIDLASSHGVYIGGDDFKSGQTKVKSVLVDFLVSAGIKPLSITSYNHLGNNDGKNLSAPEQFRSKELSKSNVVDDMVASNDILYAPGEHPDHVVVIKYVPAVADSKRALDEYVSEIFMGGRNTISMVNTCEDSLLASPLILDLVLLTELLTRITYKAGPTLSVSGDPLRTSKSSDSFLPFHSVLSILSYMLKAPVVPPGTPVVNALAKQRAALENIFRACVGLAPQSDMLLEAKTL